MRILTNAAGKQDVKAQIEAVAQNEAQERAVFTSREAIPVRIVHAFRSEKRALSFEKNLASAGYATSLVESTFDELGGLRDIGSVQIGVREAEVEKAKGVAKLIDQERHIHFSSTIPIGSVQVWVF